MPNAKQWDKRLGVGGVTAAFVISQHNLKVLLDCLDSIGLEEVAREPEVVQFAEWALRLSDRIMDLMHEEVPNEPGA